ncbi:MAG: peptidase M23 [Candidatus Magasanikbacteria bacterium CG11_big_fil_rev_8_21_14_0_20_43_7]|uniref:Peptidase M23 n=1 Tax=Candidatus Magasanikbacteria bacterium CG11_big_fil_rev_8_21_14_0_20_43_7 TaxID=1974654 RepID=A0A2H0N342_9BACT|nr:MAG: peptidase M23 [Candidatus Magasanikbacteria bacterium CG11_big_fil_rev_8_21_14_0_20_43_7]
MKRTLFILILIIVAVVLFFWKQDSVARQAIHSDGAVSEMREPEPVITKETFSIEEGDTFASVIERMGYSYEDMQAVLDAGKNIYDFTSIKLGSAFVVQKKDGVFDVIVYDINSEEQALITKNTVDEFVVTRQDIPYDKQQTEAHGVIQSSLFVAGNDAGIQDRTILALADVFAWEIDFATVIQEGDSFSLIYEKRSRDGESGPDGNVLVATFMNQGKTYTAVRFVDPDGGVGYYAIDGTSLQKPFLKAPVTYSRISSGFTSARFHPVTKSTAPHLAIDYAAPLGTSIHATGDGVVTRASWNGGYGNFVAIRHNDVWDTHYAHLSRYAVKAGDRVQQGDVIGYVGSTGWSTGPHVHYEMVKNGVKVNPLTVELPAGDPIKDEWRASFEEVKGRYETFFGN